METTKIITAKQAVIKGVWTVLMPAIIILFGIPLFVFFVLEEKESIVAISAGISLLISWLYWSFRVTKWRIWAYDNVRNLHELLTRAERVYVVNPQGHRFEKTEIRLGKDKERLEFLEKKFDISDQLETIEKDIIIYRSLKGFLSACFVFFLYSLPYIFGIMSLIIFSIDNIYFWGYLVFMIVFGISFFRKVPFVGQTPWRVYWHIIKDFRQKVPQLTLTKDGLEAHQKNQGAFPWNEVLSYRIERNGINDREARSTLYLYTGDNSKDVSANQTITIDLRWTTIDLYYLSRILARYTNENEVFDYF